MLAWGPVSAGATHPNTAKLLYRWSLPHIITEKVSNTLYKVATYQKDQSGDGKLVEKGPFSVNRLHPYSTMGDGMPSVACNTARAIPKWSKPRKRPEIGDSHRF